MRVLLAEDEPLALRRLVQVVQDMFDIQVVGTATDGDMALAEAQRLAPDVVVLDVEMPGLSGIEVAAGLSGEGSPQIIILSAFDRYATDAFAIEATDYLLKPLRPDRLRVALGRAGRRRAEKAAIRGIQPNGAALSPTLHVTDRNGGCNVPTADIIWIEAARDYVLIHTATRSHLLRSTMTELAARLPDWIRRVHRSAFVNLAYVQRWATVSKGVHRLVLADDATVQVGPSYVTDIREALRR